MLPSTLRALTVLLPITLAGQTPPVPAPAPAGEPRITAPLADDDAKLAPLLARAGEAVKGGADGAALLASQEFAPLRELTPFRKLVCDHAPRGEVRITLPGEPGQAMVVRGSVNDRQGKPVADALVYAYHTSSKGWYSDRAPHFTGERGGDIGHARLFCYVRTDQDGRFVVHTIRPGGYPRSDLPEHIHLHIDVADKQVLGTEVVFADDARLTKAQREQGQREGFVLVEPKKGEGGMQVVSPVFTVDVPARAGGR